MSNSGWGKTEEEQPIDKEEDDLLDNKVYAERIAKQLKNDRMKTIALIGPYGCGKTSILHMVKKKIEGCSKDSKYIVCLANEWGVVEGTGAENILKNVVRTLSEHVDCLAISRLPAHYRRAMAGAGQTPLKILSELLSTPQDPEKIVKQRANCKRLRRRACADGFPRFKGLDHLKQEPLKRIFRICYTFLPTLHAPILLTAPPPKKLCIQYR